MTGMKIRKFLIIFLTVCAVLSSSVVSYGEDSGNAIVDRAYAQIGNSSYAWGSCAPGTFDPSGLVSYCLTGVYNRLGTCYTFLGWPEVSDPQPGDVCVNSGNCGIYIGEGMMIHMSPQSGAILGAVQDGMIYVRYTPVSDPSPTPSPGWVQDEDGARQYINEDGTALSNVDQVLISGNYYCFDEAGYMRYGWYVSSDGSVYYLGERDDGARKDGWLRLPITDEFCLALGIDHASCGYGETESFYFGGSSGLLRNDSLTEDGITYVFDANGVMISQKETDQGQSGSDTGNGTSTADQNESNATKKQTAKEQAANTTKNQAANTGDPVIAKSPDTGDSSSVVLFLVLGLAAMCLAILCPLEYLRSAGGRSRFHLS